MKPSFSVSLVLLRLLYQHSVAASENYFYENDFYEHGPLTCRRCNDGWFVRVNCTNSMGTECKQCTDCKTSGQKNVSGCTLFSDTVCGSKLTTIPTPTPETSAEPMVSEWTVIALYITASVVLLLIITATTCKLYLNHKAPLDPAKKPLKTQSVTESLA